MVTLFGDFSLILGSPRIAFSEFNHTWWTTYLLMGCCGMRNFTQSVHLFFMEKTPVTHLWSLKSCLNGAHNGKYAIPIRLVLRFVHRGRFKCNIVRKHHCFLPGTISKLILVHLMPTFINSLFPVHRPIYCLLSHSYLLLISNF